MTARVRQDGSRSAQSANESSLDRRSNLLRELPPPLQFTEALADADFCINTAFEKLAAVRSSQQQRAQQEKLSAQRGAERKR